MMHLYSYLCIVSVIFKTFGYVSAQGGNAVNSDEEILNQQQTRLREALTRFNIVGPSSVPAPKKNLFKFLDKCADIFKSHIDKSLFEHKLVTNAFLAFRVLFESLDKVKIQSSTVKNINKALDRCKTDTRELKFRTGSCPVEIEKLLVFNAVNQTTLPIKPNMPLSRQFNQNVNDVIIEVPWKIFTYCDAYCRIPTSANTKLVYEMERMFIQNDIQQRWFRYTSDFNYLKGIISANDLMLRMRNLDAIVAAAHFDKNGKLKTYLHKPRAVGRSLDFSGEGMIDIV